MNRKEEQKFKVLPSIHMNYFSLIGQAFSVKSSTCIPFSCTQFHSFRQPPVYLIRTCTFSQFNNHTPRFGRTTAVEGLNQEISLHWKLICHFVSDSQTAFIKTPHGEVLCLTNSNTQPWWLVIASPPPKKMCPHNKIILTICVISLAKGEIPSPGQIFFNFLQRKQPPWDKDVKLSDYVCQCSVCKPRPMLWVIRKKRGSLNNVSLFLQVYLVGFFFPPLKDSLNLCKWHCHPLKHANVVFVLCYEVTALQKVKFPVLAVQEVEDFYFMFLFILAKAAFFKLYSLLHFYWK